MAGVYAELRGFVQTYRTCGIRIGAGELQVLKGNAPPFTVIADNHGAIDGFVSNRPSINARGAVAFSARLKDGGAAVVVGRGGNLTAIADTGSIFGGFGDSLTINNQGKVAFVGDLKAGGQGVFVGTGRTLTTNRRHARGIQLVCEYRYQQPRHSSLCRLPRRGRGGHLHGGGSDR